MQQMFQLKVMLILIPWELEQPFWVVELTGSCVTTDIPEL